MPLIRLAAAAVLALAAAACSTPQGNIRVAQSPLIDEPSAPFPYNSRFCP